MTKRILPTHELPGRRVGQGRPFSTRRLFLSLLLLFPSLLGCERTPPLDAAGRPLTIGTYRVRTFPKGANVYVDGKLEVPSTPATLILEAGEHHLRIIHPGATEAYEETITVEAGQKKTLDVRIPAPPRSTLAVLSNVDGAGVRINGYRRGVTPLEPVTVRAGAVDVTVTAPDGRARSASTRLGWGEHAELRVDFLPDDADAKTPSDRAPGRVTLVLAPEGYVEDDAGERLGETPLRDHPLPPGERALWLRSKDGRYARRVVLFVESGQRAVYRFRLGPEDRIDRENTEVERGDPTPRP